MFNGRYILIAVGILSAIIIWHSLHQSMWSLAILGGLAIYGWKKFMGHN